MPGERIVLECQKCSTRYEIFSEEDIDLCKTCGSCIQTVRYGFISPEPVDTISSEHRSNTLLMAKAKIVKMPPEITGKRRKLRKRRKRRINPRADGTLAKLHHLVYWRSKISHCWITDVRSWTTHHWRRHGAKNSHQRKRIRQRM